MLFDPHRCTQPLKSLDFFQKKSDQPQTVEQGCVSTARSSFYPIIIGGVRILITGNDFWGHPVWSANESVSSADCTIQLCAHPKVHYRESEKTGSSQSL